MELHDLVIDQNDDGSRFFDCSSTVVSFSILEISENYQIGFGIKDSTTINFLKSYTATLTVKLAAALLFFYSNDTSNYASPQAG